MADKVKITIDGVVHEVDANTNVLQAILHQGQVIPHFCYHEALGAVGSCRLCACMISPGADKPGRMEMSCMVRPTEGMVVTVNDDYSEKFRKQVIEDLMLNHPHDCPVCDEGGECMLQDMTVLSEHQHRRNRFPKRTWKNQDLGPHVHHEMNRCITCYRCVRYYRDYALGDDLGVFGSRDRVYFGRVEDGTLESEFSGNLVDVCPTGVFTNKRFRENYTRPWDLQTARSVCVNCSVGCNVLPGYRHNTLRRIKPAENAAVNKYFMCDRGRYGGEFVNIESRLQEGRVNGVAASAQEALDGAARRLKEIAFQHGANSIVGIGSERSSMESNAALSLLLKGLGSSRFTGFTSGAERAAVRAAAAITVSGDYSIPTLQEMEESDFILVVGGDLTGEAPMMDLSIRQAIKNGAPLYIISPRKGALDKFAKQTWRSFPGEEANILSFISSVPANNPVEEGNFVHAVAAALQASKKPLILCSTLHSDPALVEAAASLAKASTAYSSRTCRLAYFYSGANSVGLGLLRADENPDFVLADLEGGRIKALIICERDLTTAGWSAEQVAALNSSCELVIAIDSYDHSTTHAAHVVLPCVSHYQGFGTLMNYEGRGQRFDGMHFSTPVHLAASEVLVGLIKSAGVEESIGGTEFHDVFDITPETGRALDACRVGDNGCVVRTSSRPAASAPAAQGRQEGALRRWDVYHVFGSEPLSALSPAIVERTPAPYIEISPQDARARNIEEGQTVEFAELRVVGPVHISSDIAEGIVAVPVNHTTAAVAAEVTP